MKEKDIDVGDWITVKVGAAPYTEYKKVQVTRIGPASHGNDGRTWHMLTLSLDGGNVYMPALDTELARSA